MLWFSHTLPKLFERAHAVLFLSTDLLEVLYVEVFIKLINTDPNDTTSQLPRDLIWSLASKLNYS